MKGESMSECVICQGAKTVRLPVYRRASFIFDDNAALSMGAVQESYRTYRCPECSGDQAAEEKVSVIYAEQTVRHIDPDAELSRLISLDLARATAEKLLRDGLIEIRREKRGDETLFYSKLGAVAPRVVHKLETRAFDKMKEMLGGVLSRAIDSISVWGSHYTGKEGMISKGQAIDYVNAAFKAHMNETADKLGLRAGGS